MKTLALRIGLLTTFTLPSAGETPSDTSPRSEEIRITCIPKEWAFLSRSGVAIGPKGGLGPARSRAVRGVIFEDHDRSVKVIGEFYGHYVKRYKLDPKKPYTFVLRRTNSSRYMFRIQQILDGEAVKYARDQERGTRE